MLKSEEVADGIRRVTFALPLGIDHVHFQRGSGGGFILIDTALGFDDPEAARGPVLAALDAPVERIVVTHMHPDHAGGAADLAALTGAPVHQGREDYAQVAAVWTPRNDGSRIDDRLRAYGMPETAIGRLPGIGGRVRIARAKRSSAGSRRRSAYDAAGRAHEIVAHHGERLDRAEAALAAGPRNAWEVALALFGSVAQVQQRFALTESLAHLERLFRFGRAHRVEGLPVRFGT